MKCHNNPNNNPDLLLSMIKTFGIALVTCLAICIYDLKTIEHQLDSLTALASNLEEAPGAEPSPDPEPSEPLESSGPAETPPSLPSTTVATPPHLEDCIYPFPERLPGRLPERLPERLLLPVKHNDTKICIQNVSLDILDQSPREVSQGSTAKLSFSIRNLVKGQKIAGLVAVVLRLSAEITDLDNDGYGDIILTPATQA